MTNFQQRRQHQGGNVLFLILIAVALFAALSYVVTQSTRSGGGSTEREKNILSSAQMTQYPTALRTAIIRMVLAGTSIENVKFDTPTSVAFGTTSVSQLVFHPQGGGATFQDAPADLSATGGVIPWQFNANFDVPGIGISGAGGNDVVAYLAGVSAGVCRQVNTELSIDTTGCGMTDSFVPDIDPAVTEANFVVNMDAAYTFPTTNQEDLQGDSCTSFTGQASGCFYDLANTRYIFYSVLLER